MQIDVLSQAGQIGTLVVGSVGICVALLNQRRQLNAQMFIEFSGRFQELLRLFPTDAWLANRNPSQPLPPSSQELTDCTLYTMQFIADVYYLHTGGYISKNIWTLWEREIKHTLTGPRVPAGMGWGGGGVRSQPRLPSVHKCADALQAPTAVIDCS